MPMNSRLPRTTLRHKLTVPLLFAFRSGTPYLDRVDDAAFSVVGALTNAEGAQCSFE